MRCLRVCLFLAFPIGVAGFLFFWVDSGIDSEAGAVSTEPGNIAAGERVNIVAMKRQEAPPLWELPRPARHVAPEDWSLETIKQAIDSRKPLDPILSIEQTGELLVLQWLNQTDDAREISNWFDARSDRTDLDKARAMLAKEWVEFEPEAMVAWVESLPEGYGRDGCVELVVRKLTKLKEGGLEMAQRLVQLPDTTGVPPADLAWHVVSLKIRSDPENAITIIQQAPLPANEKERIIGEKLKAIEVNRRQDKL